RWNIINWVVADEHLDTATMVLAQELAHGPSIANAATKRLVCIAVNEGVAAADEAMAEIQRPIMRSADFRTGVRSYRENGIGMAEFEGRRAACRSPWRASGLLTSPACWPAHTAPRRCSTSAPR